MTSPTTDRSSFDSNRAGDSMARIWIGRLLMGVAALFLIFDGVSKVLKVDAVTTAMAQLGYPENLSRGLGVLLLICVALYLIPRTAVLGAVLLTGFLGGAIATNLRVGNPLFSHVLFPVYVALMIWGALYLRDARVRALIPARSNQ